MIWKNAILKVMEEYSEPLHYTFIAEQVAKLKYRKKNELGANPAHSVMITIINSMKTEGESSPFRRSSRGYYTTADFEETAVEIDEEEEVVLSTTGIINALGMYWERSKVIWKTDPKIYGKQQQNSESVDFGSQVGI